MEINAFDCLKDLKRVARILLHVTVYLPHRLYWEVWEYWDVQSPSDISELWRASQISEHALYSLDNRGVFLIFVITSTALIYLIATVRKSLVPVTTHTSVQSTSTQHNDKIAPTQHQQTTRRTRVQRGYSRHEPLDWREAIAQAERTVGFPTSFLNLRWLFNDEIASTAIHLRKLVGTNHPLLKSAKNLLMGSKSNLQSMGLIILLVSKAAGLNTRDFTDDQYDSGILHSQRALAEIVEMKRTGHMIHKTMANLQDKEKIGDKFQDLLCGNKIVLLSGDYLLAKCLQHLGGLRNNEVTELISTGLRDLVEGDFLGERGPDNTPVPTKPKAENLAEPYDWENEYNLDKLGSNVYLGQGKEEWVLRTMLQSGSILGKGCQAAMKLARRCEMERDAYILGGHLALMWQLYLDIKDFFTHPHSYSLVGAPVIMAIWEYPSIYGRIWISKIEKKPIELKQLHYAVRSTRCMDYLVGLLDEELAAILKYSDRFPVEDAREALQKMALTIHGETLQYMEK